MSNSFNRAIIYLTNAIQLTHKIHVVAIYKQFEDALVLGATSPRYTSNIRFLMKIPKYRVGTVPTDSPKALAKQGFIAEPAVSHDIAIALNPNTKKERLVEVICHELLHGLGFVSGLGIKNVSIIHPTTVIANKHDFVLYPMDFFIKLTNQNIRLPSLLNQISVLSMKDKTSQDQLNQPLKYLNDNATTKGTMAFVTNSGLSVPLETSFNPFIPGS